MATFLMILSLQLFLQAEAGEHCVTPDCRCEISWFLDNNSICGECYDRHGEKYDCFNEFVSNAEEETPEVMHAEEEGKSGEDSISYCGNTGCEAGE